ncbi:DUF4167 domain-containing protein [Sphingoaurantiacus capsulatus]|uniref:DUF4167 domain-containing protein n=1 Tax=Sphingoaurantiacus capsulatus TaxID=1771310 RepID=A0ABV7X8K7_9SPHN
MRNGQNGRRRGRGGPGGGGGPQRAPSGGRSPDMGNRNEVRVRGNAHQLLEKYKQLARDASMQGDRVSAEYYMQYADHYYRVLNEFRARQEEQQAQRQQYQQRRDDRDGGDNGADNGNDNGDDYGDDDDDGVIENAAPIRVSEMTRMIPEPQADAPVAKGGNDSDGDGEGDAEGNAVEAGANGEEEAPRRRSRSRGRRPRREGAEEGELAPAD